MPRNIDSDSQIGRRLRLRDLHLFLTVVQEGSMAKAASRLGISQPAVSEVIAALEDALGVRLFDRNTRGVEPTVRLRPGIAQARPSGVRRVEARDQRYRIPVQCGRWRAVDWLRASAGSGNHATHCSAVLTAISTGRPPHRRGAFPKARTDGAT